MMRRALMRCPDHSAAHRRHAAWVGRTILALIAVLGALVFAPAYAWAAGKAIAVHVEGNDAESVRSAVLGIVPERLRVVDSATFTSALAREGQRGSFGPTLTQARQRDKALARIRKAAVATSADAVVTIRVKKSGPGGLVVMVLLVDQIPGDLTVDEDVTLPSGSDARKAALRKVLESHLEQLAGPKPDAAVVAPIPGAVETKVAPPPEDEKPAREKNQVSTALVVASVAFEVGGRRFAYSDPITSNTRDYDVFGAPMPSAALELYPAAGTSIPFLRDLGLTGSFSRAVGISSATKTGTKLDTTWMRIGGGLRARFRPGSNDGPVIGLSGGINFTTFNVEAPGTNLADSAPDVTYASLRGGLDARIPFWRMALLLDAGYDGPLSAGKLYDRFTGSTVGGVDFGAGLAILIAGGFEARLTGHYTRYFYSFDPVPGDPYVAGGALDELLGLGIGVAYAY
jgi:uncharacterized protein YbjQ (UPF0145 family)